MASPQQFALKADDTADLASAVLVDAMGVITCSTGTQTTEAGQEVTTNTIWIKLSSSFSKDNYSGTITYIIANHV